MTGYEIALWIGIIDLALLALLHGLAKRDTKHLRSDGLEHRRETPR